MSDDSSDYAASPADRADSRVVGLVPAPELPRRLAELVANELGDLFRQYVDDRCTWHVEMLTDPVIGADDETNDLVTNAESIRRDRSWTYALCLTDLPIFRDGKVTVAEASAAAGVAFLSLPALGPLFIRRRVREASIQLVNELHHGSSEQARDRQDTHMRQQQEDAGNSSSHDTDSRQLVDSRWLKRPWQRVTPDDSAIDVRFVATSRLLARAKLLVGMIRANRPWTILPAFKGILAIAFATGAYSLIFPSLWRISDAYEWWRYALLMVMSISAMIAWLIVDHGLWEPAPSRGSRDVLRRLYNLATVGTLLIGVLCYYAMLLVLFAIAVVVFIPGDFMSQILQHQATFATFATLAWLVSSVATIAGALGSSLESDEAVRNATYGFRQKRRLEKAAAHDEDESQQDADRDTG